MRALLYRVGATLFSAAAVLGLFTVSAFPLPLWRQVLIALSGAAAVQLYLHLMARRQKRMSHMQPPVKS